MNTLRCKVLVWCGLFLIVAPAFAAAQWQHVSQGVFLNDLAFGSGRYVATGYNGLFTSTDGATWQPVTLPTSATPDYHRILWNAAQHQFVAVGYAGMSLSSPDGLHWTTHITGSSTLADMVYVQGEYVAVSSDGKVVTSADGHTWALHATPAGPAAQLLGIAWNGSRYVAAGRCQDTSCPFGTDVILTSTNGASWTTVDPGTASNPIYADGIAWGNGEFVVVGESGVLTSANGNTWARQAVNPDYMFRASNNNAVRFEDGRFVATGLDSIPASQATAVFTSSDGKNWSASSVPDPFRPDSSLTSVERIGSNYFVTASDGSIFATSDLAHWTTRRAGSALGNNFVVGIATHNGRYLTYIAPDTVSSAYVSLDGVHWNQQGTRASRCNDMAYSAGLFVCTAQDLGQVYTSPDESHWVARSTGIPANTLVYDVLATSHGFIGGGSDASGTSTVLTSPDGITWTEHPSAAVAGVLLDQVAAGPGGYYALGSDITTAPGAATPHLLFSTDGDNWTELSPDWSSSFAPTLLVGRPGLLVAAGTNFRGLGLCPPGACQSEVFTSTDGTHWTQQNLGGLGIPDATNWQGGAWGGGLFELDAITGNNGNLAFLDSHDGVHWHYTTIPASFAGGTVEYGVNWSGNQFTAVLGEGGIYRLAGVALDLVLRAPASVSAGQRVRYRIRLRNARTNGNATGVVVSDTLPANARFLSARFQRAAGTCTVAGRVVTCRLAGQLAAGARAAILVVAQAPRAATTLADHASVVADQPYTDHSTTQGDASTRVVCKRGCLPRRRSLQQRPHPRQVRAGAVPRA